jgi:hypothetical protein
LLAAEDGTLRGRANADEQTVEHVRILHAYAHILQQLYGIELGFEYPIILTVTDPETALDRHFRLNFDARFLEVKPNGELPQLSDMAHRRLMEHLANPQVLMDSSLQNVLPSTALPCSMPWK